MCDHQLTFNLSSDLGLINPVQAKFLDAVGCMNLMFGMGTIWGEDVYHLDVALIRPHCDPDLLIIIIMAGSYPRNCKVL